MSEEKHKPRIISRIALIIGIVTLLSWILMFPAGLWNHFYLSAIPLGSPDAGHEYYFIGQFLNAVAILSIFYFTIFWPLIITGFILSVVTLFIERNKNFRLLPLAFYIVIICAFAMGYVFD
ncbi:MAG: hypothetical protein ACYSWZ_02960 [Planctomycetota bacterium]|jgi:hypothetical protein